MRIVLDTNVIASAIFFGGKPKEVVDLLMNDKIDCFATVEIIEEYMETVEYLREKYSKNAPRLPLFDIESKITLIESKSKLNVCRDPDDNKFIECALDAKCYYIVSGDKDLLDVKKHKSVQIVTVSEFLDLFNLYSN